MKKIIVLILSILPILAFGNIELFQISSDNSAGKFKVLESGDMYRFEFSRFAVDDDDHVCEAKVWSDLPDHYIFTTKYEADLTDLIAIMSGDWCISNVEFRKTHMGVLNDCPFVSLSCSNLPVKMNNEERFQGKLFERVNNPEKYINLYKQSKPV